MTGDHGPMDSGMMGWAGFDLSGLVWTLLWIALLNLIILAVVWLPFGCIATARRPPDAPPTPSANSVAGTPGTRSTATRTS